MRLSSERIKALQTVMLELHGIELTDEQAQEAGLRLMRFVLVKAQREQELLKKEMDDHGQLPRVN